MGAGPIIWGDQHDHAAPDRHAGSSARRRISALNIVAYGARPIGAAIGAAVGGLYGAEALASWLRAPDSSSRRQRS